MAREIKFEYVWKCNVCERLIREIYSLDGLVDCTIFHNISGDICEHADGSDGTVELIARRQFTGLNDNEGDDIYEDCYIENTLTGMRYRVMYVDGRYTGQFVTHGNICGGYCIDSLHKVDLNFFRCVGNVHEGMEA